MPDPDANDEDLLRAFARRGDQLAFRRIVERHAGLVTGVVRRQLSDAGAAEETVQNVFALLARKAGSARATPTLAGWLCRTALFECRRATRRAVQNLRRLHALMNHPHSTGSEPAEAPWQEALPHLDKAMAELSPADRDVLLLRYHGRKSFRDISVELGKSEDASQKQAERALEKLGRLLRRRGVTLGIAALSAGLAGTFSLKSVAPAAAQGNAASSAQLARHALERAPGIGRLTLIHHTLETMDHPKTVTFLATLLIAAVPLGLLWKENTALRDQIAAPSLAAPPPSGEKPAKSGRRGPFLTPRNDKLAEHKSASGVINWTSVLEDPDPVRRAGNFHAWISNLTPESAQDAADVLAEMRQRNTLSHDEWKHFLRAWGAVDGQAALACLEAMPENSVARSGGEREAALAGWGSRDAAGAQAWVADMINTDNLGRGTRQPFFAEDLINAVSQGMRVTDRDAARDYLVAHAVAGNVSPGNAASWAVGDINADPPGTAAALLARLPADASHQEIRTAILSQITANRRTAESVELATQFQSELDSSAVNHVASYMGGEDSRKAMAWVDSLSHVSAVRKVDARANIVSSWAASDPDAAGSWLLDARRRGEAAPAVAASFAQATVASDPAAAIAWAQTIPDDALRHQTLVSMAQNRQASSDTEAVELLKAAGVAENELMSNNSIDQLIHFSGSHADVTTAFIPASNGWAAQNHNWANFSPLAAQTSNGAALNRDTLLYAQDFVAQRLSFVPAEPQPITRRAIVRPE